MSTDPLQQPRPKSPIAEKYRSRLMLTYRTNITGTPLPQRLPFRVLVLGKLTSNVSRDVGAVPDLRNRPIHSIQLGKRGTRVDDFMTEIVPWVPLPESLQAYASIPGEISLEDLRIEVASAPDANGVSGTVRGTARFSSEKYKGAGTRSRDVLRGEGLTISGEIKLKAGGEIADETCVLTVSGVLTQAVYDPLTSRPVGKKVFYLEQQQISIPKAQLERDPEEVASGTPRGAGTYRFVPVAGSAPHGSVIAKQALAFTSLGSFSPDGIVRSVPELLRLRVIRDLVLDLQSTLRNNEPLRKSVSKLLEREDASTELLSGELKTLQEWVAQHSSVFMVRPRNGAAAASTPDEAAVQGLLQTLLPNVGGQPSDVLPSASEKGANASASRPATLIAASTAKIARADARAGAPGVQTEGTSAAEIPVTTLSFLDRDPAISDSVRLINAFGALLLNLELARREDDQAELPKPITKLVDLFGVITGVSSAIEREIQKNLDVILHAPETKELEANWRGLDELASAVTSDDVIVDFLDATKDELFTDLQDNSLDIFGSALFEKVYVNEYDRFGGRPFAAMIGLYEFESSEDDVDGWLRNIQKICAAAHCPFIGAVKPEFFGGRRSMEEVAAVTDLDAVMNHPRMSKWNALRNEEWSAYIGLTLPRYLVRLPWDASDDAQSDRTRRYNQVGHVESVAPGRPGDESRFLWGNASILFAKNVIRSYERSGWAQHIRGPRGGGAVDGLVAYTHRRADGREVLQSPVEIAIPDYREYQFARNGLIPLVQKKGEASATFFSAQSIKRPKDFVEDLPTKNAYLVTNLAYTFSVTTIAHYVKAMMREYIGSTADGPYIQQVLSGWLSRFVTTVVNPDDLTLLYYPFKATSVVVEPKVGPFGWYVATVSVLPHVQFEGMDVELRLEAALGAGA